MVVKNAAFLVLFTVFFPNTDMLAAHYDLSFSNRINLSRAPGYNQVGDPVSTHLISAGDTVAFSDGKVFTIQTYLGRGINHAVYAVGRNLAIRVPVNSDRAFTIADWVVGYYFLVDNGVAVNKAYHYYPDEYILVKKYQNLFNVFDLYSAVFNSRRSIGQVDTSEALQELRSFVVSAKRFSRLGDTNEDSILYTDSGWVVVDFTAFHKFASSSESPHILESAGHPDYERSMLKIKQEVIGARKNDIGFDYSDANEERLREKMEKRVDELSARKSDFSPCARLRRALGTFHPSN